MTRFSIIIPVYNVEEYIERCLDSITRQSFNDFEVIIIDDCGTDTSVQIAHKYAQEDSRFKFIPHKENLGTGISRNDGIDAATGEYICFVDPDDWVEPNYLETLNNTFLNNPNVNWVLFKYNEERDEKMKYFSYSVPPKYFNLNDGIQQIFPHSIFDYTAFCWAKAYNLNWLREKNIRYAETTYEETLFYMHCFLENPNLYVIDKYLYNYTIRPNSWTTSEKLEDAKNNIKSLEYLMEYVPQLIYENDYNIEYLPKCMEFLKKFYKYQCSKKNRLETNRE